MGIKPKHDNFVELVCGEWGRGALETDPYNLLLRSLGGERELEDGGWEPLSDDIYYFDTECVEGNDIYADVFGRLAVIAKGGFEISSVSSKVSHRHESASVLFTLDEKEYAWQLNYDDDWFDLEVIGKINSLLKSKGSSKFFYVSRPDQSVKVVFDTDEIIKKLNGLVTTPFGLDIFDSEQ